MKKDIQILLETVTRCGGNCSGCALSSSERMSVSGIDWSLFRNNANSINKYLSKIGEDDIESISIFLGQGDHFLMSTEEMNSFMEICSSIVPKELKHKSVIFITASAIGKEKEIKEKMDMFYNISLEYGMPFFIQVVFDPKKIILNKNFANTYIKNILYFKEKCGMTELTVNLGDDVLELLTPIEFHEWIKKYGFKHVEFNWVLNKGTKQMWERKHLEMFKWLKEFILINDKEHEYEINFIPFLKRAFMLMSDEISYYDLHKKIVNDLTENIYIDTNGSLIFAQAGLVSNLIPVKERLFNFIEKIDLNDTEKLTQKAEKESKKIIKKIFTNEICAECEFKNVCSLVGTASWMDFNDKSNNCPFEVKSFMEFLNDFFKEDDENKNTFFDKNPIQNKKLDKENNANYEYFEGRFATNFDNKKNY